MSVSTKTTLELKQMIADVCAIDGSELRDEGRLAGYGIESLRMMEILKGLEDRFGLEIREEDPELRGVRTIAELAAWVESRHRLAL